MKQADVPWDEISNTQDIMKKAEIESIADRIVQLEKDNDSYDDLHKARMIKTRQRYSDGVRS